MLALFWATYIVGGAALVAVACLAGTASEDEVDYKMLSTGVVTTFAFVALWMAMSLWMSPITITFSMTK